jgi:hypothetical protein
LRGEEEEDGRGEEKAHACGKCVESTRTLKICMTLFFWKLEFALAISEAEEPT